MPNGLAHYEIFSLTFSKPHFQTHRIFSASASWAFLFLFLQYVSLQRHLPQILFFLFRCLSRAWWFFIRSHFRIPLTELFLSGLYLLLVVKRDLNKRLDENRGLNELFLDIVAKQPKKVAIIDIESDKRYTFEEFNKEANKFANYFQVIFLWLFWNRPLLI